MKRKIIFLFLIMIIGLLATTTVFAANVTLNFEGEGKVAPEATGKVILKLTSDEDCGLISGKVKAENGLTLKSVTGKNGWSLTYNKDTGDFKLIKDVGAKVEETLEIEYTAGKEKKTGKILIENAKTTMITDTGYELLEKGTVSKEISIGESEEPPSGDVTIKSIKIVTEPTKKEYTEGEDFDPAGMKVVVEYSDGKTEEITSYKVENGSKLEEGQNEIKISYIINGETFETVQNITVNKKESEKPTEQENEQKTDPAKENKTDNTVAQRSNPDTGIEKMMIPIGILMVLAGVGFILYTKNKNI